jgi:PAS domain S-box-containing protein
MRDPIRAAEPPTSEPDGRRSSWVASNVRGIQYLVGVASLAALYFVTAKLGIGLEVSHGVVTPVWAPTGISLAALLLFGSRLWPGVAIGALAANATSDVPLATALLIGTGNTLEALCGAYLLRRVHFDNALERVQDVLALVTLGALVSTTVSASIGTAGLWLTGEIDWHTLRSDWVLWWFGDAMGDLLVAPLLLVWGRRSLGRMEVRKILEAGVLLAALVAVSLVTFRGGRWNYSFAVFPLLVWGTLRFRQRGATTTAFVVSTLAIWATLTASVPFGEATIAESLKTLQVLMAIVAVANLILAATITERERAEEALREEASTVQLLKEIAVASNEAATVDQALQAVLDRVCALTSWPVGHALAPDATGELTSTGIWHLQDPERFEALRQISEAMRFAPEVGLPGRVLSTGQPAWIADVAKDPNFPRARLVSDLEVKAGFAFPVLIGDEAAAVVEFFSADAAAPDEALLGVMAAVGTQVGRVVERQRAESALKASEMRNRDIIETARDAFVAIDETGAITEWNGEAETTFGWSRQQALGRNMAETIIPPQHRPSHQRGLQHLLATGEGPILGKRLELTALHREGHEFPVELVVWAIHSGDTCSFNAFVRDISERKRQEAFREQFIANAAHELRTPLTSILGLIDVLWRNRQHLSEEKTGAAFDAVRRSGDRLADLVNELLDLAKLQRGEIEIRLEPVPLASLSRQVLESMPTPKDRSVELRVQDDVVALADSHHLDQVLLNLFTNAFRYGGPEVMLEAEAAESAVVLSITDNGPGVEKDLVPHLFDPFARGSTSAEAGGCGLGLAIVRGLVEASGGEIWYEVLEPTGARFCIRLPRPP